MTAVRRTALLVLAAVAVPACEPSPSPGDNGPSAPGSAGPGPSAVWHIEEEFRLGTADLEGPELFGEIRALAVDSDGTLVIVDGQANDVRRFSPSGEHIWTVGRSGQGPGEFRMVLGMTVSPDDDVWIVDAQNARLTLIDAEGEVRTAPRSSLWGQPPWVGGFGLDGYLYELSTIEGAGTDGWVDLMLAVDGDGVVRGEYPIPRDQPPRPTLGAGVMTSLPFEPVVLRAWDPEGGVWQALSSEYRIYRVNLQGDTTALVARDAAALPFTPRERDLLQAGARRAERLGAPVDPGIIPSSVPPLRWFTVDDHGQVWVCASGRDLCRELDVYDASGQFLGAVALPAAPLDHPRPVIRNGRLHAAVEGPAGSPQVWVGRIVRP